MDTLKTLYYLFYNEKKERVEMVLEPLQAMTQLAIMSHCPIGSKLSISNNLLYIQTPSWSQCMTRSYNHDKKDDLYFLFSVINRFNNFYFFITRKKGKISELFDTLIEMSKTGIDKIIQTYSRIGGDYTHLLQTLKMYRKMLERPDVFSDENENKKNSDKKHDDNKKHDDKKKDKESIHDKTTEHENERKVEYTNEKNMDAIFIKINELYTEEHLNIIFNTLKLIKKHPEDCVTYMNGLNHIFNPVNTEIKKWIHENIIF